MRMEADRMTNLVLTDEVVATERDVILEERRQVVENVPGARLREQVAAALFLNHPYGRPIIGWEHEIRGLTRADAEAWYRRWYAPNNAVLVVAGDVAPDEVRRLAEQHYGPIPRRDVPERVRPAEPVPQAARRVTLRDERVRQPSLTRAYLAPSARRGESQHVPALEVLADIAGGQAGRFHRALVLERQLATSVSVSYNPDSFDLSTFSFGVAVRPGVAIEDVERALDEEIAAMLREGVAEDEVERTKARVRDSTVLSRDALGTAPRAIGADLMTGATIEEIESWPRRIGAVTAAQVAAAARAVLQEERGVTGFLLPRPRT
jgi:zinc protease